MPYTDRHGRPELLMHPDIARGVTPYRVTAPPKAEPEPMSIATEPTTASAAQQEAPFEPG